MKTLIALTLCFFALSCAGSSTPNSPSTISGVTTFTVTSPNAPSNYTINNQPNPGLTLQRGQTYTFNVTAAGHPFFISTTSGMNTANTYNTGVTGNNAQSGMLTFVVPQSAPNTLFYNCSNHNPMSGMITITN